jgi:hypothetical protein
MLARRFSTAVLPMVVLAAWASSQPLAVAARPAVVTVALAPSAAVVSGPARAMLAERGGVTDVSVEVTRVPSGITLPVHLYTYLYRGSCDSLSPQPERRLTRRVLADTPGIEPLQVGPYTVGNTLDMPLAQLRSAPRAILVRSGPADGNLPLYCGNLS